MWGIEIQAEIHRLNGLPDESLLLVIPANQCRGTAAGVEFPRSLHSHDAEEQNLSAIQGEEIGALPHVPILAAAAVQLPKEAPAEAILAAK